MADRRDGIFVLGNQDDEIAKQDLKNFIILLERDLLYEKTVSLEQLKKEWTETYGYEAEILLEELKKKSNISIKNGKIKRRFRQSSLCL